MRRPHDTQSLYRPATDRKGTAPLDRLYRAAMASTLSNRTELRPLFACNNDPYRRAICRSDGAETGAAEPHTAKQAGLGGRQVVSGRLGAVLEAPAVVTGLDDVAVVSQSIEHGGRHFGVAEHLRPVGEGEIGGDQQRGVLIELADQME